MSYKFAQLDFWQNQFLKILFTFPQDNIRLDNNTKIILIIYFDDLFLRFQIFHDNFFTI